MIANDEPIIDIPRRIAQCIVTRTADQTGDADFQQVLSPDLQRFFAHQALITECMKPQVLMDVGG